MFTTALSKHFLIASLLVFFCPSLQAQNQDPAYIGLFDFNNQLNTGLKYKDLEVRFFADGKEAFSFSNSNLGFSLGGRIGKFGLSYTFPLADLGTSTANQGRNSGLNLQFFRPNFFLQLSGQRVTGFQAGAAADDFRADVKLSDLTLYGFRVENPKLSLRAAFRNNRQQLISQGSWLKALSLNYQVLNADSIAFPRAEQPDFAIDRYQQYELGFGLGYAYTFVLKSDFYITPVAVIGPEFRLIRFRDQRDQSKDEIFRLSPRFRGRLAFGQNGERLYWSITYSLLPGIATSNRLNSRLQDNLVRLRLGWRFS
ncbi:MAG: DUF4421 family protein [Bacteroidota bacterium]